MGENIKEKIEDKVIDLITSGAVGRLVVFKPDKSLGRSPLGRSPTGESTGEVVVDLVVEKRGDYKKDGILLNVYDGDFSNSQNLEKEVSRLVEEKKFGYAENFYLVFLHFDFIKQELEDRLWVIPSLELEGLIGIKDFSKFLMDKKDFINFFIEFIDKK